MTSSKQARPTAVAWAVTLMAVPLLALPCSADLLSADTDRVHETLRAVVKLYGAGGLGRIESQGSGILVSADGFILTVLNPLLESAKPLVVLDNGRRIEARIVGVDSTRELALLKVEAEDLPFVQLRASSGTRAGDPILAYSNCFNIAAGAEAATVQRGVIAAVAKLRALQGFERFSYPGRVLVLDATTNNPGAAGGAITDPRGRLLGMIGKEVQSAATRTWVHYAIPCDTLFSFAQPLMSQRRDENAAPIDVATADPMAGSPRNTTIARNDLKAAGIQLLPNLLDRTPPFVDGVLPGSVAEQAGVRADDLIVFVNDRTIQDLNDLQTVLGSLEEDEPITITLLRGDKLLTVELAEKAEGTSR
ncbi:Putative serine protease HhoA precursor [Planctomycetes bacterium Pan216]|uniref:Serine protease HhoA n=1 Tax=Kolteria novifilia TaxID=2527975 RepID=A0A518B2F1_9BACT|nr:Putative serine protease HhoA precursor [Planctomycetes bacterium Pan216]